eukprot:COSAG06_NODE_57291_length_281_cov_0.445055_1_plen_57_part_10
MIATFLGSGAASRAVLPLLLLLAVGSPPSAEPFLALPSCSGSSARAPFNSGTETLAS